MVHDRAIDIALQDLLGRPSESPPLAALQLGILSADEISTTTFGEVLRSEMISFDTLEASEGGLFCERVFGSLEPHGNTRESKLKTLDSPFLRARDDEVLSPRERAERFGSITLPIDLEHPMFSRPRFRSRLLEAGLESWPLQRLSVLPPELRPIVAIAQPNDPVVKFVVSDLNDLYRYIIQACSRVVRLRDFRAPSSMLDIEVSRLGDAVAQLFDNRATLEPRVGPSGRPLAGLWEMLANPNRPTWETLAELDGMVARGIVRTLRPPLAKRSYAVVAYLRALGIGIALRQGESETTATLH